MSKRTPTLFLEAKDYPKTLDGVVNDVVQHWHRRHLHSKALVVCEQPEAFLKLARKQWLRLTQRAQQERLNTVGADRILDLTYIITRMQHVALAAGLPHQQPAAHLWCIQPLQLAMSELPATCKTVYVTALLDTEQRGRLLQAVASHGLVVDYTGNEQWQLAPKAELDQKVLEAWGELSAFFAHHQVDTQRLVRSAGNIDAIDDALDTLLDVSSSFLRHAHQFQEVLYLAEPVEVGHALKQQFDTVNLLARRVAALTPTVFSRFLTQSLDDETFFLHDQALRKVHTQAIEEDLARHRVAGRANLVRALEHMFMSTAI